MVTTIAVTNQKGGVGKTTCCINLAAALAKLGKKILLIDLDPQGNATMGSGVNKNSTDYTTAEILLNDATNPATAIVNSPAGYSLLPANDTLTTAAIKLLEIANRQLQLKQALAKIANQYDLIIIDCPPSLNMLTVNALVAANAVLIPIQCEYYALEGLAALLKTIKGIKQVNPKLYIAGLIRTMYDARNKLTNQVSNELQRHFGKLVYQTAIPRNVRLAEAPSHGQSIFQYEAYSKGALAFMSLAEEFLHQQQIQVNQTNCLETA